MIDVLIVDDHPLLRAGAIAFVNMSGDCQVVGEAESAHQALDMARTLRPQVVLLDIQLKGDQKGTELARILREELPEVKVLVLTNFAFEPYVRSMMEIGVEGYLLKDTPPREIVEAIRMIAGGRTVYSSKVAGRMMGGHLSASGGSPRPSLDRLTPKEAEVLQLLAHGDTNDEIAKSLNISSKAVQVHLTNIYSKLGVRSRTEAIVAAVRRGLVVIEPVDSLGW